MVAIWNQHSIRHDKPGYLRNKNSCIFNYVLCHIVPTIDHGLAMSPNCVFSIIIVSQEREREYLLSGYHPCQQAPAALMMEVEREGSCQDLENYQDLPEQPSAELAQLSVQRAPTTEVSINQ